VGYTGHEPRVAATATLVRAEGEGSGGGDSARTWDRAKPGARAVGGDVGRTGGGVPGARVTGGGGGQRAYLRGPGEAGDTGWQRRLVLREGGGSCRVAAAAALASCDGERSGGMGQLLGQGRGG
jgi:hypothetical protein